MVSPHPQHGICVYPAPGCPYFLDRWQYVIAEMEGKTYGQNGFGIPVLTYEELAGLVLGYDPWDLGLQLHQVAVEPLLDKMSSTDCRNPSPLSLQQAPFLQS